MKPDAALALFAMDKFSVHQCEIIAKEFDGDSVEFDLVGPTGRVPCRWLDPHMGVFLAHPGEPNQTMMTTRACAFAEAHCENIQFPEVTA